MGEGTIDDVLREFPMVIVGVDVATGPDTHWEVTWRRHAAEDIWEIDDVVRR